MKNIGGYMSIYERVRAAQTKAAKAAAATEYKTNESTRRATAARLAAEVRREKRDDLILEGKVEPRNAREAELQFRALYSD
jgi:hypothetical protein